MGGSLKPLFLSHPQDCPSCSISVPLASLGASGLQGLALGEVGAATRGSLRLEQGRWEVSVGGGVPRFKQASPSPRALSAQAPGTHVVSMPRSQLTSRTGERVYQRFLKRGRAWKGVLGAHFESQGSPPLR